MVLSRNVEMCIASRCFADFPLAQVVCRKLAGNWMLMVNKVEVYVWHCVYLLYHQISLAPGYKVLLCWISLRSQKVIYASDTRAFHVNKPVGGAKRINDGNLHFSAHELYTVEAWCKEQEHTLSAIRFGADRCCWMIGVRCSKLHRCFSSLTHFVLHFVFFWFFVCIKKYTSFQ